MELGTDQLTAIEMTNEWFYNMDYNLFIIAGYAGTGKSTVLRTVLENIGIPIYKIAFGTYTGKAAVILRKHGFNAFTLHKLLYRTFVDPVTKRPFFAVKKYLPKNIELLVIDEVGMVPDKMIQDALTFGIPVIGLGDPGQLSPIYGKNSFITKPNTFLKQVFRQAEGSSLLTLATDLRNQEKIYEKKYGLDVKIIPFSEFHISMAEDYNQILCSMNRTKKLMNILYRKHMKIEETYPILGEKLICLLNNFKEPLGVFAEVDIHLVNGLMGFCNIPCESLDSKVCNLGIYPDFIPSWKHKYTKLLTSSYHFLSYDGEVDENDLAEIRDENGKIINRFDFGYAITTHKSQGSEWDNVIVLDDCFYNDDDNYYRWLYTSVTRARKKVLLVKDVTVPKL